jgi:hypothetical protein
MIGIIIMKTRTKAFALILALVMACSAVLSPFAATANTNLPAGAIAISTARELDNIRNNLGGHFYLTRDIDASSLVLNGVRVNWTPIGTQDAPFTGTFDGRGFQITNMRVGNELDKRGTQGFFGAISGATIRNLTISGTVIGVDSVGSVAGFASNGSVIDNVINRAEINGQYQTGGFVGVVWHTWPPVDGHMVSGEVPGVIISNSANLGDVNSTGGSSGGIVGTLIAGTITRSFNTGNVTGGAGVGGLVGVAMGASEILDSYNTGNVTAERSAGGVTGALDAYQTIVRRTYSSGNVTAKEQYSGGLIGFISLALTGGRVGAPLIPRTAVITSNAVLSNVILIESDSPDIKSGTIYGDEAMTGYIDGRVAIPGERRINPQNQPLSDSRNLAADNILGNATNNANATLPRSEFSRQATWENLGFDFGSTWIMPPGANALPTLRWQTGGMPTVPALTPVQHAQRIFNRLNSGVGEHEIPTGPDLGMAGAATFLRFINNTSERRVDHYNSFRGAARVYNFQETLISAATITVGLFGGFDISKAYDVVAYTFDLAGGTMPWGDNVDNWVFDEAVKGNVMVQTGQQNLARLNMQIRNSGGRIADDDLATAIDYILAYIMIEQGMSSLVMGRGFFTQKLNTSRLENLGWIIFGLASNPLKDALMSEFRSVGERLFNPHIIRWHESYDNYTEELERWQPYINMLPPASIREAVRSGIVPRELQTRYQNPITRAEFAALGVALYETATGSEITGRATFSDTSDVNIRKMGALGVIRGSNARPNAVLRRDEVASYIDALAIALGKPLPEARGMVGVFDDSAQMLFGMENSVRRVFAAGIMIGTGINTFSPQMSYTREESIRAMYRLFSIVSPAGSAAVSTHGTPSDWAAGWQQPTTREAAAEAMILLIEAAGGASMHDIAAENGWDLAAGQFADTNSPAVTFLRHAGVVGGVGDNRFDPGGEYSRAHTVALLGMIAETFFGAVIQGDNPFTDVPDFAMRYIGYAAETFGIGGIGGGLFDPDSAMQNEMTAVLSYLAYQAWS